MTNELWNEFNQLNSSFEKPSFMLAFSYKNGILNQIFDTTPDDKIKQNVLIEQKGMFFFLSIFHKLSSLDCPEKINSFEEEINQFVHESEKSDLEYYEKRFNESNNDFDKIHYGYITWFSTKKFSVFNDTLNLTFSFLQIFVNKSEHFMEICDTLCFLYNIITIYGFDENKLPMLKSLCEKTIDNVHKDGSKLRYLIEPVVISAKISKNNSRKINELLFILHKAANILKPTFFKNFGVIEGLLRASIKLVDFLRNLTPTERSDLKNVIHEMIGNMYQQLAENKIRTGQPQLVAAHFYQIASDEYKKGNNVNKYQECLSLCSKNTIFDEYIEVQVELPRFHFSGETEYDLIDILIKYYFDCEKSLVDTASIKPKIITELDKNPLRFGLPHQNYSQIGPSSPTYSSREEIIDRETDLQMKNSILLFESIVSSSVMRLETNKKITAIGICKYLDSFNILDKESIFILERGITYHFNKEYVASIHVLIPQIETILRKLLALKNASYFKEKHNALMVKELGGLLDLPELKGILNENIIRFFKIKYTNTNGINLRNNLSHGLLKIVDFNHSNSFSVIYSLILLLKIFKEN